MANVDCRLVWGQIGEDITLRENLHIYETAAKAIQQTIDFEKYDPDKILEVVSKEASILALTQGNLLAFVPLTLLTDWSMRFKVTYEGGNQFLLIPPKTRIRLIHSWNRFPFEHIVIIDKARCRWLYQRFDGDRFKCNISPGSTSDTVAITAESRGQFLPQSDGLSVIKLPKKQPTTTP